MNKGVAVNDLVQKYSGVSKMFISWVFGLLVVGFFYYYCELICSKQRKSANIPHIQKKNKTL